MNERRVGKYLRDRPEQLVVAELLVDHAIGVARGLCQVFACQRPKIILRQHRPSLGYAAASERFVDKPGHGLDLAKATALGVRVDDLLGQGRAGSQHADYEYGPPALTTRFGHRLERLCIKGLDDRIVSLCILRGVKLRYRQRISLAIRLHCGGALTSLFHGLTQREVERPTSFNGFAFRRKMRQHRLSSSVHFTFLHLDSGVNYGNDGILVSLFQSGFKHCQSAFRLIQSQVGICLAGQDTGVMRRMLQCTVIGIDRLMKIPLRHQNIAQQPVVIRPLYIATDGRSDHRDRLIPLSKLIARLSEQRHCQIISATI